MNASLPPPGSPVRATIKGLGVVHGDLLDARINRERFAICLWGSGKTIVVAPDELEAIEVVNLSSAQIVEVAKEQRTNPNLARPRDRAVMP